jgi:thymidine kinase
MTESVPTQTGRIEIILGPVFSGKTSELFRRVDRLKYAGKCASFIKYESDSSFTGKLRTHTGLVVKCQVLKALSELDTGNSTDYFDVIAIDEAHNFPDIAEFAVKQAEAGKIVIISALDGILAEKSFSHVMNLIPHSKTVDKLNAMCRCGQDAAFTKRLESGNVFMPSCKSCLKPTSNTSTSQSVENNLSEVSRIEEFAVRKILHYIRQNQKRYAPY